MLDVVTHNLVSTYQAFVQWRIEMKKIIALSSLFSLVACSSGYAIRINVEPDGAAANGVYSLFLDAEGDTFDSIDLTIVRCPGEFLNVDNGFDGFTPRGPGEEFTYINALLAASTAGPGGQGWSLLSSGATPTEVRIAGGPLGSKIETAPAPGLFLANVMFPVGALGHFSSTFVNDGVVIGTARKAQSVISLNPVVPFCSV